MFGFELDWPNLIVGGVLSAIVYGIAYLIWRLTSQWFEHSRVYVNRRYKERAWKEFLLTEHVGSNLHTLVLWCAYHLMSALLFATLAITALVTATATGITVAVGLESPWGSLSAGFGITVGMALFGLIFLYVAGRFAIKFLRISQNILHFDWYRAEVEKRFGLPVKRGATASEPSQ